MAKVHCLVAEVADHPIGSEPQPVEGRYPTGSLGQPGGDGWGHQNSNGDQVWSPDGWPPDEATPDRHRRSSSGAAELLNLAVDRTADCDSQSALSVLIIDDCTLFRENLAAVLAANGITAARLAWDLPSVVMAFDPADISLVLLNMSTAGSDLLLRAVMDIAPAVRVIVFGVSEQDEESIIACAEAGVAGYHMRTDSLASLITMIRNVAAGESFCPAQVSTMLLRRLTLLASTPAPAAKDLALTAREAQILKMLELGRSNRDIADHLEIAVHTVKNHVHNLLTKLGVSSRAQAAALSRTVRSTQGGRQD
ncbi:LuxR C-terminal-related transcriptional regulator [Mycolicibacterium mengxianglii]|uniref:LuxR C-terminal-related transcriptional regulator n=1 Tax=Mycolicibacterium mengxianglii TaxID=2736649 RepID=UPI0018D05F73|nr:response regulator transcription factor [Mycolicibacterium mengxianglii]